MAEYDNKAENCAWARECFEIALEIQIAQKLPDPIRMTEDALAVLEEFCGE
jgi:hypothetical protein